MAFTQFLEYESKLYLEVMEEDGLVITAKGLGLDRILLKVFHTFCNPENLVLVLNTSSQEQLFFINELNSVGVKHLPKVLTADNVSAERERLYFQGGVFFVSSRILVVDMLTKRLPIEYVTGILVHRAHKIGESSQESFILRLFRESNSAGFIKGFSDNPNAFVSGYSQVERVMKRLFVRNLYLRPRFYADVVECLEKHKPDVIELTVELTPLMSSIQLAILDLLENCLRELKKCAPLLDPDEITVENSLTKSFDKFLKSQLDPHWNQLSNKARQLVSDVRVLRVLLSYLTLYDCVTFYNFLQSLRTNEKTNSQQCVWMFLDAADSLFVHAKARVFGNIKKDADKSETKIESSIESSPKWDALSKILDEIEEENHSNESGRVLICASDERTCYQLRQLLCEGSDIMLKQLLENSPLCNCDTGAERKTQNEKKKQSNKRKKNETKQKESVNIVNDYHEEKFTLKVLSNAVVVIHPLSGCSDPYSLLRKLYELEPKYVVLYDTQMEFVRQLEVYKASRPGIPLRVYFLIYHESVEEQRYLTTLRKEKEAFELLIRQKAEMVVPEEREGKSDVAKQLIRSTSGVTVDTRKSGGQISEKTENKLIIVDMREFRSDLPSLIHKHGIDIEPVTLEVGDYILSPDICVERKSISDLIGSLNSGRLYTQCVAMTRFYKRPILLIEFDEAKSFSLQAKNSLSSEVSLQNISSKLTLLTIHFAKLRIIWSQSPHLTAEIFEDLKSKVEEPNAQVAMAIGVEQSEVSSSSLYNMVPLDVVQKFPGFNSKNYRLILNNFLSLKDLVNQSEESISAAVGNAHNSKMFVEFVSRKHEVVQTDMKKRKT